MNKKTNIEKEVYYLKNNKHYYCKETLVFIMKAISFQIKDNQNLKIIGIDAKSGYGKSYMARCLNFVLNNDITFDNIESSEEIKFLKSLPSPSEELKNTISMYIPLNDYNYSDVGNGRFNSFVVIFYYFYYDGGYLGVLLCSMFYGFFTQKVMQGYLKHKNYDYLVLLMLILSSVSYATIRYSYIYIYNFMSLIYWFILFKVLKTKIQ